MQQGLPFSGCWQLSALARIFAQVVLPVPLVPINRYAWDSLPVIIWFLSVSVMCSCPTTSSKVLGLHFRYKA